MYPSGLTPAVHHVLLTGPRDSVRALAAIVSSALDLRRRGVKVTTPLDLVRRCGALWGTTAYARAKAEALLEVDAVVVLPGWRFCVHTASTAAQAEALELPILTDLVRMIA